MSAKISPVCIQIHLLDVTLKWPKKTTDLPSSTDIILDNDYDNRIHSKMTYDELIAVLKAMLVKESKDRLSLAYSPSILGTGTGSCIFKLPPKKAKSKFQHGICIDSEDSWSNNATGNGISFQDEHMEHKQASLGSIHYSKQSIRGKSKSLEWKSADDLIAACVLFFIFFSSFLADFYSNALARSIDLYDLKIATKHFWNST